MLATQRYLIVHACLSVETETRTSGCTHLDIYANIHVCIEKTSKQERERAKRQRGADSERERRGSVLGVEVFGLLSAEKFWD